MPNHVTNKVTFKGSPERVKELREKCKDGEREFSFQSFYPMPVELFGTTSPARIVSEEEMQEWRDKFERGELKEYERDSRPITEQQSKDFKKRFGTNNWYDWHIQNWGTKWDCYDVFVNEGEDHLIQFNTAWSTPLVAMAKLSELFPDIEIHVKYADEDFGSNVGYYTLMGGIIAESYAPIYSKESVEMAMEIFGDKDYWLIDRLTDETDELTEFDEWCIELAHEEGNLIDEYPVIVLIKLLDLAIADEQYERAGQIKKIIEGKVADVKK